MGTRESNKEHRIGKDVVVNCQWAHLTHYTAVNGTLQRRRDASVSVSSSAASVQRDVALGRGRELKAVSLTKVN